MAKTVRVRFTVLGTIFQLRGADYWYGDGDISNEIGVDVIEDEDLDDGIAIKSKVEYQRYLVRMVATLANEAALGIGDNSAQDAISRSIEFWCHPRYVEEAMQQLPGKDVDANLLPGDLKIQNVFLKVDSNLR